MSLLEKKAKTTLQIKNLYDFLPQKNVMENQQWVRLEDAKKAVYDESVKRQTFHAQAIDEQKQKLDQFQGWLESNSQFWNDKYSPKILKKFEELLKEEEKPQ